MAQLDQTQWMNTKHKAIQKMNLTEVDRYDQIYQEIEKGIEEAKTQITMAKEELAEAKTVRNNKMQYNALAKVRK